MPSGNIMLSEERPDSLANVRTLLDQVRRERIEYRPSPADWRDEVLYFLLPDRFTDMGEPFLSVSIGGIPVLRRIFLLSVKHLVSPHDPSRAFERGRPEVETAPFRTAEKAIESTPQRPPGFLVVADPGVLVVSRIHSVALP